MSCRKAEPIRAEMVIGGTMEVEEEQDEKGRGGGKRLKG